MHVVVIGMNHRTAPVHVREELAMEEGQIRRFLSNPVPGNGPQPAERVILSTCNRFEFYMALERPEDAWSIFWRMASAKGVIDEQRLRQHVFIWQDDDAVRHLFRVAAGLDSMVLGESQILGQVGRAYELAQEVGATGAFLSRLFEMAVHAGKRARSETAIGRAHVSVASAAVHLLMSEVPHLTRQRVLVVGAGQMGRLVARYFQSQGVHVLAIINRTFRRAVDVARDVQARAYPWEMMLPLLTWADVVVVTTGAISPVITRDVIETVAPYREGRPLTLVDISVPRNVAPEVGELAGIRLFDIDALKGVMAEGMQVRQQAVPHVESIIETLVMEYRRWRQARAVAPTISALYAQAESVRRRVLERTLRRYRNTPVDEEVVEEVTRILVDKLLQIPARNLHLLAREGQVQEYDDALRRLFEIGETRAIR